MKISYWCALLVLLIFGFTKASASASFLKDKSIRSLLENEFYSIQDTVSEEEDTVVIYDIDPTLSYLGVDEVDLSKLSKEPSVTLHQLMAGQVAGVYSQQVSGEPGTVKQNTIVRGGSHPVLSPYDFNKNRPLIVMDGIPLIDDPSIVYDIQDYSLQPLGTATSMQSVFDADNIESIHVLKDYSTASLYGPQAANGVIYIQTKNAQPGERKISINGYSGFAAPSSVTTLNADWEKRFRQPFYDRYATPDQQAAYPAYLSDSSNVSFYGPSNWVDDYYKVTPLNSLTGSLLGGGERSNFRLFAGFTSNSSAADETSLKRYQGSFHINMLPAPWMTVSSMLYMTRLDRERNRSIPERLAETGFIPDMSTPISPNKSMYSLYLDEYQKTIDDNYNNSMIGQISVNFRILKNLNFTPRFAIDYNENKRDVFWPSTLMAGNNYVSNYFGFNERTFFDNKLTYDHVFDNATSLLLETGMNYQSDVQKYNYSLGYKGPNDFIKVNVVEGNSQKTDYLKAIGFIPYYYSDRIQQRLLSFYGRLTYSNESQFKVGALVRRDGSSWGQPTDRWFTSYAVNGEYDFNYHLQSDVVDALKLGVSYGRLGSLGFSDHEAAGPQYNSSLGWEGNNSVLSFNGIGTINRPYSSGWVGYDLPWSYNDMFNLSLDVDLLKQLSVRGEYYIKDAKEMVFAVPTVAESGYESHLLNGMGVENKGFDFTVNYVLPQTEGQRFGWQSSFNIGYNTNKLTSLPNQLEEIIVGDRKLKVGERIDKFWLFENQGIYLSDLDVPVDPSSYKIMTYNGGVDFKGGDPRWTDVNGDYNIDDEDKKLMGNITPKYIGGFYNKFTYGKIDLGIQLYFNLRKDIINAQAARYFDFANMDESTDISGVRDITFWEQNFDDDAYPLYNPWSSVSPYQTQQDMFMEDGSFLKLRSLNIGYDFTSLINMQKTTFDRFYAYVSGSNLLTITKYSGKDPELVDFFGYDRGMSIRIPRTFTMGIKLDF